MKRLLATGILALGMVAQAQDQYSYPFGSTPMGIDAYGDVVYYYSGGKTFNMRNFPLSKSESIIDFKVSPDGRTFAVVTANKKGAKKAISLYSLWKGNDKLAELKKLRFNPVAICYTANSHAVLAADESGIVHVLGGLTLRPEGEFALNAPASQILMSPDNYYLAAVSGSNVDLWDYSNQMLRRSFPSNAKVNAVAFSADSRQMAVLSNDGVAKIYDLATMECTQSIEALGQAIDCSFHPEGKYLAVGTGTSRILVLNLLNPDDRSYIDADGTGIEFIRFVYDKSADAEYLAYNTTSDMVFKDMSYLSPMRSKLVADKLKDKMDEWERQLPGESLEEYMLRVNDATRADQLRLFEQEIATELALGELVSAEMTMGSYDMGSQMLALNLNDGLGEIYLEVPQADVASFMDPYNLEFRNAKYGINALDEYELLYADIYNKATGKTYTYDNLGGQFIDYIADKNEYAPLELVEQTTLEETSLSELTTDVMNQAKDENILTEHTHIDVGTRIVSAKNDEGEPIRNYEVSVTYTVDQEFSAKEDYPSGKYATDDSPACMAMLKIVKDALGTDFAKYMQPGKKVNIEISGTADAMRINRVIPYSGVYGDFTDFPIVFDGENSEVTVTSKTGITDNKQLAFLRAAGVKCFLFDQVKALDAMQTNVDYNISVSDKTGSEYRKVSVKFTFVDAFDK